MIHTFTMYSDLQKGNIEICSDLLNADYIQASNILSTIQIGIIANIVKMHGKWRLCLFVDVIKLLGKANIGEEDYSTTQKLIDEFTALYFGEILDFTLTRLEYRFDAELSLLEREFLLRRYKKIIDKHYFSKKNIYKESIYHSNKSKSKIVYDKESERDAKGFRIESYEKDILRYEVKLLNSHLYYQNGTHGIERNLENYWKYDLYKRYFTKEFKPLLYKGDYYKLYDIVKMLEVSNLKQKDIDALPIFLNTISKYGISKTRKDYSYHMFKKYIDILEDLNINPIIITKNEQSLPNNKYLENPLSDIYI